MRSHQTRRESFAEAVINVSIGYLVALAAQAVILPAFGIYVSTADHMGIAACFTVVSLVRLYVVRRFFERAGN